MLKMLKTTCRIVDTVILAEAYTVLADVNAHVRTNLSDFKNCTVQLDHAKVYPIHRDTWSNDV